MVNVYDVGDVAPLRLTVDPADYDTLVRIRVRAPSGVERPLAASPSADRSVWTSALELTEPGLWRTVWAVEGTGAGVETHVIGVRPTTTARTYATSGDLAAWTADAPPLDADALLTRATRVVDRLMVGARWSPAEGSDNLPADPTVAAAYRDATCAQVAAWLEAGAGDYGDPDEGSDNAEAAELAEWARAVGASSIALGDLNIGLGKASASSSSGSSSSAGGSGIDYSTPAVEAADVLRTAGLYPPRVGVLS